VELMNEALTAGADPNTTSPITGSTALMEAARYNSVNCAPILVEHGADVNAIGYRGMTALMNCMMLDPKGRTEIAALLLDKGADITIEDNDGRTAIMHAAYEDNVGYIRMTIDKITDINDVDHKGLTALMIAAGNGCKDPVCELLKHGASTDVKDNEGWTALMHAARLHGHECIGVLIKHGADVNEEDEEGFTPLLRTAESSNCEESMYNLIDHGADIDISAFDIAAEHHNDICFIILLAFHAIGNYSDQEHIRTLLEDLTKDRGQKVDRESLFSIMEAKKLPSLQKYARQCIFSEIRKPGHSYTAAIEDLIDKNKLPENLKSFMTYEDDIYEELMEPFKDLKERYE
ncbi:unnamed protein product, partial [Owenia fusiformis]